MKKKTLSGLLAICMVVAMLPTQAFASTGNLPVATQDVNVTSTVEEGTPETTPPPTDETLTAPPDDVVDAVASVLARIRALPTMDDIEAQKPESEEFSGYLAALRADIAAARGAYDALTNEQKATVDDDVLAKLTELELMLVGVLAATTMAAGDAITIAVIGGGSTATTATGATLQAAVETSSITATAITKLTITGGNVTPEDWRYIKSLTALTTFTVDNAVDLVDAIPDVGSGSTFPTTIVTVSIAKVTTIGTHAFDGCAKLTTATFPAATTIGQYAFKNCVVLTTATLPAATMIDVEAFNGCIKLTTVSFPAATTIGTGAFNGCIKLETASFSAVETIDQFAFNYCPALTTASFPAATEIGANAFNSCAALKLTNTSFPKATSIGNQAFTGCTALATADFPAATAIGKNAFEGCKLLATTTFTKVKTIGESAFEGCTALATASFPAATAIGTKAFKDCTTLAKLQLGATPPTSVGANAFTGTADPRSLEVANATVAALAAYDVVGTNDTGTATDGLWQGWALPVMITVAVSNGTPVNAIGATLQAAVTASNIAADAITELTITAGKVTKADWEYIKSLSALTTFTVADEVTSVANIPAGTSPNSVVTPVFPKTIVTVTIPNVTSIGLNAFKGCIKLTNASFPAVTSIGTGAFSICEALTTVSFPAVATIDTEAFNGCTLLDTVSFPAATTIGTGAFNGCVKLTTATFPAAKTIGASAFNGCTKLATLKLGATVPNVTNANAFTGITADPRSLVLMKADGTTELTGNVLNDARKSYDEKSTGGTTTDGLWYGWELPAQVAVKSIKITTQPTKTAYTAGQTFDTTGMVVTATYVGGSTAEVEDCTYSPSLGTALAISNNKVTVSYTAGGVIKDVDVAITVTAAPPTPTGGGGGGGGSGSTTTAGNVIDNPVGSSGSVNPLAAAKTAVAASKASTTSYVNYTNYQALTKDGLKAINDAAAAAVKGTKLQLNTKVQLDSSIGGIVTSRITVDPAKLTAAMPDKLGLKVWFDQKVDTKVIAVNNTFDKYFTNKLVTITFEEVAPLSVSMVLALKPDLSGLNVKNLHFYSYNPTTNLYSRIATPSYWVDRNGYSHITAPLGGSIIITDRPLTRK